jgi:pimeloyl-ACP methyl ester carboxylesterase
MPLIHRLLALVTLAASIFACTTLSVPNVGSSTDTKTEQAWTPLETNEVSRSACEKEFSNPRWLKLHLDPFDRETAEFELFYFLPNGFDHKRRTVLIANGGPGGFSLPTMDTHETFHGDFNIVDFHFRGAGCSRIPLAKSNDFFIRSRYAIADLEALREKLGLKKWDVIHGYSYGTALAQMYAYHYSDKIGATILEGVFGNWPRRKNFQYDTVLKETLKNIVVLDGTDTLKALSPDEKNKVLETAYEKIASLHPNAVWVTTTELAKKLQHSTKTAAQEKELRYLLALEFAIYAGWSPSHPKGLKRQAAVAAVLANEAFPQLKFSKAIEKEVEIQYKKWLEIKQEYDSPHRSLKKITSRSLISKRVFDIIYEADLNNYEPSAFSHDVPSVIIQGDADAATPLDGALDVFETALKGPKHAYVVHGGAHGEILPDACYNAILKAAANDQVVNLPTLAPSNSLCKTPFGTTLR